MLGVDRRAVQNFDWVLSGLTLALVAIGIGNLISAAHGSDEVLLSPEVRRQLASLGVGCLALLVTVSIDYRHLERFAILIYLATVALVASTLIFAPVTRGSQSWLVFGSLSVQPAEFAKIGLVLAMARFLHRNPPEEVRDLRALLVPFLIVAVPVLLIILQRDKGVALLTLLIGSTYLPFLYIPFRIWAATFAAGLAGLPALWFYALEPYQRGRILDFVDPSRDPLASGYQAIQSRIAVGAGGVTGSGYMEGTQTQLNFLPTRHTDFAFSVLAEEWGFLGGSLVLALFLALLLWGLYIARNSKDSFGAFIAVGVVGTLFWPAVINVAMVLGLAPVIGVPLPFLSYGGSALVVAMIGVGLLLNVSMRRYVF
ncbi:MAG: rod shape-determining protein RodA [Deltaproteobacteria bacterium]|nr:MAG: rod shape-determining protein RodA [Deltaproteobacteria bacterium]